MLPHTWHRKEVVHGGDVIHGFGQDAHLLLPLILENIHVVLSHLALWTGSQSQRSVDDLYGSKISKISISRLLYICVCVCGLLNTTMIRPRNYWLQICELFLEQNTLVFHFNIWYASNHRVDYVKGGWFGAVFCFCFYNENKLKTNLSASPWDISYWRCKSFKPGHILYNL